MTRNDDSDGAPNPRATQRGWSGDHAPGARQGTVISDRYRIGRLLGRGGMGEVYEAQHLVIGRRFAIKFVRNDMKLDERVLQRFRREAQAAGRLEHENIAAVYDLGSTPEGDPFIVLECLEGEDLSQVLSRGPQPPAIVAGLVRQAALGLHAAHEHGIVHRDLKPANLFLCRLPDGANRVKLLDFGIAKLQVQGVQESMGGWMPTGTPQYMSPEQAAGRGQADRRMDVYALGAIMYEALSGRRPQPGEDYQAVLRNVLNRSPAPLASLRSELPVGLIEVVERAMSRDPQARFGTAMELAQALRPFVAAGLAGPGAAPAVAAALAPPISVTPPMSSRQDASTASTRVTDYTNAGEQSIRSRPPGDRSWPTWAGVAVGATAGALVVVVLAGVLRRSGAELPPAPVGPSEPAASAVSGPAPAAPTVAAPAVAAPVTPPPVVAPVPPSSAPPPGQIARSPQASPVRSAPAADAGVPVNERSNKLHGAKGRGGTPAAPKPGTLEPESDLDGVQDNLIRPAKL